ncbi:hypothetical protein niasHS_008554 [Heterodera schachtii]|uniref:Uncharacterized protein n=2 Tax=Heterodera TaxID=34509 RepID=A0ABD2K1U2_9BILA
MVDKPYEFVDRNSLPGDQCACIRKNTRHKRPKAFGLRKCPNREIRSARVSACALPSELCPAARWFFPSPGSSDAWPALCHYHLLGCLLPMRTLALNGVVSAETIRLYKTAVIAALGNAR